MQRLEEIKCHKVTSVCKKVRYDPEQTSQPCLGFWEGAGAGNPGNHFQAQKIIRRCQHGLTKGKGHRVDKRLKYPSRVSLKVLELNKRRHVGVPSTCARLWKKVAKKTEPGSFQWGSVKKTRQWIQADPWDTPSKHCKTLFICGSDWALVPDAQGGYGIFILWETQKPLGHVSVQSALCWAGDLGQMTFRGQCQLQPFCDSTTVILWFCEITIWPKLLFKSTPVLKVTEKKNHQQTRFLGFKSSGPSWQVNRLLLHLTALPNPSRGLQFNMNILVVKEVFENGWG